jgi:hypothetical protein
VSSLSVERASADVEPGNPPELGGAEMDEVKKGKREYGRTTKTGVVGAWCIALQKGMQNKWEDSQILEFMKSEFPGKTNLCSVGTARGHYNRGDFNVKDGKRVPPKLQSVRYGEPMRKGRAKKDAAPKKQPLAVHKKTLVVKKKPVPVTS